MDEHLVPGNQLDYNLFSNSGLVKSAFCFRSARYTYRYQPYHPRYRYRCYLNPRSKNYFPHRHQNPLPTVGLVLIDGGSEPNWSPPHRRHCDDPNPICALLFMCFFE